MTTKSSKSSARAAIALLILASPSVLLAQGGLGTTDWVSTWTVPVVSQAPPAGDANGQAAAAPGTGRRGGAQRLSFNDQTLRQILRVTVGGDHVRVVVSNVYATEPLAIGAAHIALRDQDSAIVSTASAALTFGGRPMASVPPGAVLVSDSVALSVPAFADLAVDLYLPGNTAESASPLTTGGRVTSYVSESGNHVGQTNFPVMTTARAAFFLGRLEVMAPEATGVVVAIGDSITAAGAGAETHERWSDVLARRLAAQNMDMGVLNVGIGGNRLLSNGNTGSNALARFDRDVAMQTGATHVILLEGINDLGRNVTVDPADMIMGYRQLIDRAHAAGLKIIGSTIMPVEGVTGNFSAYFTPENEAKREALNEWIRTGKAFDAIIDFDAIMRNPDRPTQLRPEYSSDDHIHPNVTGYKVMGNAIDLTLFETDPRANATPR